MVGLLTFSNAVITVIDRHITDRTKHYGLYEDSVQIDLFISVLLIS